MFYVYEWYNIDTGYIFYVGKGTKKRVYSKTSRNKLFLEYLKNNNCKYRIIKTFSNEKDALKFENKRILELKQNNMCSCNLDNGGTGGCHFSWTPEMKKYYSIYNGMKNAEQRNRMSKENPMKNPEIAEKVARTKRKHIIVNGKKYDSVTEAIKIYGGIVSYWLKTGYTNTHQPCYYLNNGPKDYKIKRKIAGGKPVVYNGEIYECGRDVCKKFNIPPSSLSKYMKRGYTDKGIECRKLSSKPVKEYIPYTKERKVFIDGILYESIKIASEQTGLEKRGIQYALKHSGYYKGVKCEYANQQPIPVKSEYSSREGSETNE